jgi:hypothetical protein
MTSAVLVGGSPTTDVEDLARTVHHRGAVGAVGHYPVRDEGPGAGARRVEIVGPLQLAGIEDAPVRSQEVARVVRQRPGRAGQLTPGAVVPSHFGYHHRVAILVTSRHDEYLTAGKHRRGRVPATPRHIRTGGPGIGAEIEHVGIRQAQSIGDMAPDDDQLSRGQVGHPGAEEQRGAGNSGEGAVRGIPDLGDSPFRRPKTENPAIRKQSEVYRDLHPGGSCWTTGQLSPTGGKRPSRCDRQMRVLPLHPILPAPTH